MPKRLVDDSLLTSPSLRACSPRAQDAFPRFILLADDFGCFEAAPRALLGRGWPYRDDVTEKDVAKWMDEYATIPSPPMLMLWEAAGRRWAYLTGWHGEHGQKHRQEYDREKAPHGSKRRTPAPPADILAAIMSGARRSDGRPPGTDVLPPGNEPGTDRENTGSTTPRKRGRKVPARENQIPRLAPATVPGSVVPVPVPDAVPVPTHVHALALDRSSAAVGPEAPTRKLVEVEPDRWEAVDA